MSQLSIVGPQVAAGGSAVEAMFHLFNTGALDVDLESLNLEQLMKCVGKHCEQLSKSCTNLRHIILKLRTMGITLEKDDDFAVAVQWISEGYETPPAAKWVKKYANALKGFLRMPQATIPDNPILTGTLPKWMFRGDEVDVFYQPKDTHGVWWHAVIIDDLPRNAKSCCVYWVGWEPCNTGNAAKSRHPGLFLNNPTVVNRDNVRSHIPGKCSAGSSSLHCVDWVKANMLVVHISGNGSDGKISNDSFVGEVENELKVSKLSADAADADPSPGNDEQQSRRSKRTPKPTAKSSTSPPIQLSSRATKPLLRTSRTQQKPEDNAADHALGSSRGGNASIVSFQHILDLTVTERAIATLQSLDAGSHLSEKELTEWIASLRRRCGLLAQMYKNQDYVTLGEETLTELEQYEGRQHLRQGSEQLNRFHKHLKDYGWVISPRMWTREEIIVMCVILLDPKLCFNIVLQKDKTKAHEATQNRGMACLDNRVQQIMYFRLKSYGFIDDGHLPCEVPAGVVLNSGGSFLQLTTWEYLKSARFVTDPHASPPILHVSGTPKYTFCDVVYLATTTRLRGATVYVSISPLEIYGPPSGQEDPRSWDGTPLRPALEPNLLDLVEDDSGKKWATERVLYWLDGKIHIQSVTGFGTSMFMLLLTCKALGSKVTACESFSGFNWERKCSEMLPLSRESLPTVKIIPGKIGTHRLSFGPVRILVNHSKPIAAYEPEITRPQQYHKDGPTRYDSRQFDEKGSVRIDGVANATRTVPLTPVSPGRSTSALFAFFAQTFLGLRPKSAKSKGKVTTTQGLRLHSAVGSAVLFYFDTDHQGWKCRARSDRDRDRIMKEELSLHVRAHFYMYSRDLRYLPTTDLEETFEFLCCVAHGSNLDDATKLIVLDALNTFVQEPDSVGNAYLSFADQAALDKHCSEIQSMYASSPASESNKRERAAEAKTDQPASRSIRRRK